MRVLIKKYHVSDSRPFLFLLSSCYSINDNIRYLSLSNIDLPSFLRLIQRKKKKKKKKKKGRTRQMKSGTSVLLHCIVSSFHSSIDDRGRRVRGATLYS